MIPAGAEPWEGNLCAALLPGEGGWEGRGGVSRWLCVGGQGSRGLKGEESEGEVPAEI